MTRCLMLSWEYPPVIEGGLARHVTKLSEFLPACGVEVHVLTRSDGGGAAEEEEIADGVIVHRVAQPRRPDELAPFVTWVERMNADLLARAVELGDRHRFDIVHGHDWLVAVAGDHLARRFATPLVMTIHATEYGRHQGWVTEHPQSHIHAIERWIVARAERVIACSHYMRGHLADVFDRDESDIVVIPNGIDPRDLRHVKDLASLRGTFAQPQERLLLLVGRLVYEKGFQLALAALPGLIERVPNLRFLVAGSGPHEAALRAQADALGVSQRGTFVGWIGDDLLHSLYRIADLCVVPSIYEPFGLVALEAMACGCPCIVADTGGLREVVSREDVGLRFHSRDPDSLAEMVERVLTDDLLRLRLIAEASEHVLGFDWSDIAGQTAELYRASVTDRV
jgi:glycogen(starch) synthase